ncbi:MAG TPA: hypothetical protein VFT29_09480 [Gemmatimonadaceae bacterium]|nr:hypothetical protein [Gemmatimonadaceae bacterium]
MSSAVASTAVSQPTPDAARHASPVVLLESLRALLPAATPMAPGMPTGVDALDRALASDGLPRGRLTEVVGATGKLSLLHQIVGAALQRGDWVAYIDASRTLAPRDWADLGDFGFWIVRPTEAAKAAWCADVLLRSAAFSLVVLDSAPPISRAVAVRLTGLARESNAAFVTVGAASATRLGGAVRLRVTRRRQRLTIAIEKGARVGGSGTGGRLQHVVEVGCADGVARRLCSHSEVPDRRGAARAAARGGRTGKGRRAATPAYERQGGGMLQYC